MEGNGSNSIVDQWIARLEAVALDELPALAELCVQIDDAGLAREVGERGGSLTRGKLIAGTIGTSSAKPIEWTREFRNPKSRPKVPSRRSPRRTRRSAPRDHGGLRRRCAT